MQICVSAVSSAPCQGLGQCSNRKRIFTFSGLLNAFYSKPNTLVVRVQCVLELGDTVKDKSDSIWVLELCQYWILETQCFCFMLPVNRQH